MATINVYWTEGFEGLFSDNHGTQRRGVLTTDHAASSYGMPVVVGDDGRVYGPADLPTGVEDMNEASTYESAVIIRAAREAGYKVRSLTTPQ